MLALLGRLDVFSTLLFTGVQKKVMETNQSLQALAERIRSEPDLARIFADYEAGDLRAALEKLPPSRDFLDELQSFLVSGD